MVKRQMDFSTLIRMAALLSRPFAREMLRILVIYRDISASESAHRLDVHIKTAQDFLEELYDLEVAERFQVIEHKRPYFRYRLKVRRIHLQFDLDELYDGEQEAGDLSRRIRERADNGANFLTSRSGEDIVALSLFTGKGRGRRERRLNLTRPQGRFLYHLPFPTAEPRTVVQIVEAANLQGCESEILDLVRRLIDLGIIEEFGDRREL